MQAAALFLSPPRPDVAPLARRHRLARLSLAWLANMQVMMFAFPGYFRDEISSADNLAVLNKAVFVMNWISLALTVPVVLYCAWPVWRGAWAGRRGGGVSMDVPVALGLVAAFVPSAYATWTGRGEVYFESVTMFVAFVLTARYLEGWARGRLAGRHQDMTALDALHARLSAWSQRLAFWFVLVQLGLAAAVGAWWWAWQPEAALAVTVALLVMSCPCAMAMALPTTFVAARAAAASSAAAIALVARDTERITRQSLYGAIVWHALMVPLAAVGWVAPWLAALAMLASSLAVAANAWRLYAARPRGGA